jgi:hypothetical protein
MSHDQAVGGGGVSGWFPLLRGAPAVGLQSLVEAWRGSRADTSAFLSA